MFFKTGVRLFVLITTLNVVTCDRKIRAELNPGCLLEGCKNNEVILVHVKAEGSNDTLHHLWDFTGKPSFLLALTEKNATMEIDWQQFRLGAKRAIKFTPPPQYVYGVVVDKVIEFNDESDNGELDINNNNSSYITTYPSQNFDWKYASLSNNSGDAILTVEATGYFDKSSQQKKMNGTVKFEMRAFGMEDHAESLPHLLHSGNASQMDLTLENLSSTYGSSRFGIHLITASSDNREQKENINIVARKTLDDEHAPGVFTVEELLTPSAKPGSCGGYLQWRPVVYTSSARDMTSSTDSMYYNTQHVDHAEVVLNSTLLDSVMGTDLDEMLVIATNITFGIKNDGYYKKTKYSTWTMVIGYGHPPEEQFSMLVTLVLLIGLGLPAIVILIGTVCIVLRRLQRNNDDLFLSR